MPETVMERLVWLRLCRAALPCYGSFGADWELTKQYFRSCLLAGNGHPATTFNSTIQLNKLATTSLDLIVPVNDPVQPAPVAMQTTDFLDIWNGTKQLYIYGFIEYKTSDGAEKETRFCYVYRSPAGFAPGERGFYIAVDAAPPAYIGFT